jgi:NAD(P)-dependent dehydrogenase (short-subunit alcohol dehydrogenase family)
MRFSDNLAPIAGGTRGLGRAVSLAFLQERAKVIVTYRKQDGSGKDAQLGPAEMVQNKTSQTRFESWDVCRSALPQVLLKDKPRLSGRDAE